MLPADLVVRSVGYRGTPLPGPAGGRAVGHGAARRPAGCSATGAPSPGEYVAGWIKRGPSGVVGTNKHDARETVAALLADAADGHAAASRPGRRPGRRRCVARGAEPVLLDDWRAIDAAEVALGASRGRARTTLHEREALLAAVREAAAGTRGRDGAPPPPSGRLAAVTGPSSTSAQVSPVSFARGAPSTDIVDVDGLRQAAMAAFAADPAGLTGYGTAVGYVPLRPLDRREARRPGGPRARHQRLDAGRRVPVRRAGALGRRRRHRAADLRPHPARPRASAAPTCRLVTLRGGRHRRRRGRRAARAAASGRRSRTIIPNFQNPAGYTLSLAKRERLLELATEHGFVIFEDDPYVDIRFTRRAAAADARARRRPRQQRRSSTPRRSPRRSARASASAYLVVAAGDHRPHPPRVAANAYISPNMVAEGDRQRSCVRGTSATRPRWTRCGRRSRAGQTLDAALRTHLPQATVSAGPRAATSSGCRLPEARGARRRPEHRPRPPQRGVAIVPGSRLPARGAATTPVSGWPTRGVRGGADRRRRAPRSPRRSTAARPESSAAVAQGRRDAVDGQLDVAADQLVVVAARRRRRSISTCRWCSGSR